MIYRVSVGIKLAFLFFIMALGSCKSNNASRSNKKQNLTDTLSIVPNPKLDFNIFIENSGSMDGYLNQDEGFKDLLIKFTSDFPTYFKTYPSLYFVNSNGTFLNSPKKTTPEFTNFLTQLTPAKSKAIFKPGPNSTIDNIIDISTKDMAKKVSIIFSDCILSYKGTKEAGVKAAQANIKMILASKKEAQNLSTIVIKFNSKFQGNYYNESNGGIRVIVSNPINRPYYALIFGEEKYLSYLMKEINFKKYPGYESSYTLLSKSKDPAPEAIITYQDKLGSFEFVKPASQLKIINAQPVKNKTDFQFSIYANLQGLPYQQDFLLNPTNYTVDENFRIESIEPLQNVENYNYKFTFYTNDLKVKSNLIFGLKYDIPEWIVKTGSYVDADPKDSLQQTQTFGFSYLMKGISEAYQANNDSLQFKIKISINKNSSDDNSHSKFPWLSIIIVLIILGAFVYFKNKKN